MSALTQSFEELAERAEAVCAAAMRTPPLDLVRAMLNEAGLAKARTRLRDSLLRLAEKQAAARSAAEAERVAKEALDAALVDAEWELSGCFEVRSNKTWLVVGADGVSLPEDEQRSLTADEKKGWIARQARQLPEVAAAAARVRAAAHDTAACQDALVIAEKSLGAARADLDAAIAHLNALSLALPAHKGATK